MAKFQTHYDELNVARNAPDFIIKAAYKVLCQTYHPDKFQGSKEEAERIMKQINVAYAVLGEPIKRADYDRLLDQQEAKTSTFFDKTRFDETPEHAKQHHKQRHDKPDLSWRMVGANIFGLLLIAYVTYPIHAHLKSLNPLSIPLKRLLVPIMIAAMITGIFYLFHKI